MAKKLLIGFFIAGAITMIVMSFHYFQVEATGILRGKEVAGRLWYRSLFMAHVFFGIVAIIIGPLQYIYRIKVMVPLLHKYLGYIYFTSVIFSSTSGLVIAQFAMGGLISSLGFTILSIFWFFSTVSAVIAIKKREINRHKKWMYISYGLTFAAIPQRIMLLLPLLTTIPFILIYQFSAWIPWMANSYIAYRLYKASKSKTNYSTT